MEQQRRITGRPSPMQLTVVTTVVVDKYLSCTVAGSDYCKLCDVCCKLFSVSRGDVEQDLWIKIFGSRSLDQDLWIKIFGSRSLDQDIWIKIFGSRSLDQDLWIKVFGSRSLDQDLWIKPLHQPKQSKKIELRWSSW